MARTRPRFQIAGRTLSVDLPHLAFATFLGGWAAWYGRDAWRSDADVENLILILPASIAAVILYLVVAVGCFQVADPDEAAADASVEPTAKGAGVKIAGSMALLGALVVAGPLIGFDIATLVYMFAMLALLGERRVLVLLLVPVLFCAIVIYGFSALLATPLPLLFFHGAS